MGGTWLSEISGLLTPVIAVVVAYVAWQQWKTNRNRLKLDLFEKRYVYYDAAHRLIGKTLASGKVSDEVTTDFVIATHGAKFIVGADIATYFEKELYRKITELGYLERELQSVVDKEERRANTQKQLELRKWLSDQLTVLDRKFEPLLRLDH